MLHRRADASLVRETGLEPVRCEPHAPQTCASASSATLAFAFPTDPLGPVVDNGIDYTRFLRICQGVLQKFFKKFSRNFSDPFWGSKPPEYRGFCPISVHKEPFLPFPSAKKGDSDRRTDGLGCEFWECVPWAWLAETVEFTKNSFFWNESGTAEEQMRNCSRL